MGEYIGNVIIDNGGDYYAHNADDATAADDDNNAGEHQQQRRSRHNNGNIYDEDDDDDAKDHNATNEQQRQHISDSALMDSTPLLSEDEFSIRTQRLPVRRTMMCTVAEQGFHRTDADANSSSSAKRQLIMAITLCLIFMVAEIVGGYMAGSLAIMADAAHLLSDCISFIVSLVAIWMSNKPPDHRMTFGYKRAEVIGAIMSILGIWLLTAFLCYFSLNRLILNDFDIEARTMMVISGIGIGINVIMAFILHGSCNMPHGHSHDGHHGHSHSHSHTPPATTSQQYNRLNDSGDASSAAHANEQPTFIINGHHHHRHSGNGHNGNHNNSSHHLPSGDISAVTRLDDAAYPAEKCLPNGGGGGGDARRSSGGDDSGIICPASSSSNSGERTPRTNINLQAAVIHVIGDFIQSVGVFVAAVVIYYYPNAKIVDPLCTVLFSVIVVFTTVRIMRESLAIIMDAAPSDVDVRRLHGELAELPGVRSVHDLNVWSVTVDWSVLAVHLVIDPGSSAEKILRRATEVAHENFGIRHCTVQLEHADEPHLALALANSGGHRHYFEHQRDGVGQPQRGHHRHRSLSPSNHHHSTNGNNNDAMIHFV